VAKYLIMGSYTHEGLRGLAKDKAAGRHKAVSQALAALGGKLESLYFAFGEADVIGIGDCPDNVTAAALSLAASSSGLIKVKTIPLLTIDEMDQALGKQVGYRAPGA
jgi:uncharacterized protein with GYD domain